MGHSVCQPHVQVMRLRRAALKIPAESSVPPRSPLYKLRPLPTPSESTLPQVLIPLHFKSFISNTYKKTGRGSLRPAPKFVNSPLPPRHSSARAAVLVHVGLHPRGATDRATAHPQVLSLPLLEVSPQISENTATLSPFAATLTGRVTPKSCVCHSYKKHRGVGDPARHRSPATPPHHATPPPTCHPEGIEGSAFSLSGFGRESLRHYFLTSLLHRATDHGSRTTRVSARLRELCASALSFSAFRCQAPTRFPICSTHYPLLTTDSRLTAPPCSKTDND